MHSRQTTLPSCALTHSSWQHCALGNAEASSSFCGAVARGLKRSATEWLWSSPPSRQTAWRGWWWRLIGSKVTGAQNATPQSRSEQEVAGYRDALGLIHESGEQMPFSRVRSCSFGHGMLYRYMPQSGGRWKATNNDIVERHPDGSSRIRFRPVAAHLTPAVADLIARYRFALTSIWPTPLVLAPLYYPRFSVHPPSRMAMAAWRGCYDLAAALSLRLCRRPFHQPGAYL